MSADDNKALIRRYFDAISGKDKPAAVLNEYIMDESLTHHIMMAEAGFPRYDLVAEEMIAEGDKVVVQALWNAERRISGYSANGETSLDAVYHHLPDRAWQDHAALYGFRLAWPAATTWRHPYTRTRCHIISLPTA